MAHATPYNRSIMDAPSPKLALKTIEQERKRKMAMAIGGIVALLAIGFASLYIMYSDVPATGTPAHLDSKY